MIKIGKGNAVAMWLIALVAVGVGGTYLYNTYVTEEPTGGVTDSNLGDQATLKYYAKTGADYGLHQFAGTGYCWDTSAPTEIIGGSSGTTLSATTGTTFSPATRGSTYECTSFSTTHYCDHDSGLMSKEALELKSTNCKNLSAQQNLKVTFYEDDTAETTRALTMGAGQTDSYNKMLIEVNVSNYAFPLRAICFGTNKSSSNLKSITLKNWNRDSDTPDSLPGYADDYCFTKSTIMLDEYDSVVLNDAIVFEADSSGIIEENITVTFLDECEYVASDGSIKKDYFQRDTEAQNDCGATNPVYDILLS